MKKNYHASTIQRAIDVLNLFKEEHKLSFTDIQEELKFNKSTLFRVLYTLEYNNYISRDEHGRYELGINMFILGNQISKSHKLIKVADQYLKQFSDQINMTVHLGILDGYDVIIIEKYYPPGNIKMFSRIGSPVPPHCTGQGKTLLAYSPPKLVERVINHHGMKRYTPQTITTLEQLYTELAIIRERGYTIDNSEHEKHIKCVAVPVLNDRGLIEAALSITGLVMDFSSDVVIEKYARALQEVRDKLAKEIGYI